MVDPSDSLILIFPSKVDGWILLLAALPLAILTVVVSSALTAGPPLGAVALMVGLEVAVLGGIFLTLRSTRYEVTRHEVIARSGLFRWRIAIDDIESIHPSRSPASSPALSLDRLEIRHGGGRPLLVSPKDREEFLKAIAARSQHLHRAGEQVRRM
jgi:Bacterial PH domain